MDYFVCVYAHAAAVHKGLKGAQEYSFEIRLRAVEDLRNGVSQADVVAKYGISEKRIVR